MQNSELLIFNGYTNGCIGYLHTREEWLYGRFAERLVDAVVETWEKFV